MAVKSTVGISITTAEPTLVPKKEIAAIQPLQGDGNNRFSHQLSQISSTPPAPQTFFPKERTSKDAKIPQ